ncbi:MAG TPA: methylenetetrahydrofolate reductase [Candidatus Bathyarchaeia archaeon]|nr:methylenetetrahydrofolate reductase [Candidatus Bathyarchaeia archaeon]
MADGIYSQMMKELSEGKYVFTGELEPEKAGNVNEPIAAAKDLIGLVTACNVTDNPQSFAYVNSMAASYKIELETGMECVYQLRCSDRNRMALLSDVLGAGTLGLKNILALAGDHVSLGDTPDAKPVFDLDSTTLIHMIRKIVDEGKDLGGNEIEDPPKLHVGGAAAPGAAHLKSEVAKVKRKINVGVEFLQTQVVYYQDILDKFFNELGKVDVPILVGIFPAKSYGAAKFFDEYVAGVDVPPDYLANLKKSKEITDKEKRKEEVDRINVEFFTDFLEYLKGTPAAGCHMMAVGYPRIIGPLKKVIE